MLVVMTLGNQRFWKRWLFFLETEGMKADKNDMNCFSLREGEGRFEIACEFDDLPDFIIDRRQGADHARLRTSAE